MPVTGSYPVLPPDPCVCTPFHLYKGPYSLSVKEQMIQCEGITFALVSRNTQFLLDQ